MKDKADLKWLESFITRKRFSLMQLKKKDFTRSVAIFKRKQYENHYGTTFEKKSLKSKSLIFRVSFHFKYNLK